MTKIVHVAIVGLACVASAGPALAESGDEPIRDLLASQLRDQGFTCSKPESAKQDVKQSKPNEEVWIVKCENDTFRMTVVPDLAAKVEKLPASE
ncbi:MAG TPA: hypothetical protein VM620_04900 [Hyphomicrobium sp.]|jgi:hypothetical protein|nr:hypothetical protein [Hyphomicrobium sp.]